MYESFAVHLFTITLSIGYTPVQNKKFEKTVHSLKELSRGFRKVTLLISLISSEPKFTVTPRI